MVRLSDLVKPALAPAQSPPPSASVPISAKTPPPRILSPSFKQTGTVAEQRPTGESLYHRLVSESERCLEQVYEEQRIALGDIPLLIEQILDRVAADDAELLRLSTMGDNHFSLATHGVNVAVLSLRVGIELGLRRAALVDLGIAALLHDIGMMKIRHLLNAPHLLNPEQIQEMKEHPVWGERIAQRSSELPPVARDVIAQEHERQDGSGYPRSLSGNSIASDAQLVGLIDTYEALTHDRPYRKQLVPAQATRVITQQHQQAFSKPLFRAFLRGIPLFPVESWVRLSSGDLAQVSATTSRYPLMPTVIIRYDRLRQPYPNPHIIDLSREIQLTIVEAIADPTPPSIKPIA